jgi:LacI family transcriptional regulator
VPLGLLVADITNPVLFGIVRGAEHAASANGYTLIIAESRESGEREAAVTERVLASVDGLILATTRMSDEQIRGFADRKSLVVINRDIDGVDCVLPDLLPGVEAAVTHLHELGHRRIAYLAGPSRSWISAERSRTIVGAVTRLGMSLIEVGPGAPTLEGGRAAVDSVPPDVTAIIAYNDLMAIGVMLEMAERGRSVPADVSVIGFDDIFGAAFTNPPLTTIRSPLSEAGSRAVRALLGENSDDEEQLSTELVVRASTSRPRD